MRTLTVAAAAAILLAGCTTETADMRLTCHSPTRASVVVMSGDVETVGVAGGQVTLRSTYDIEPPFEFLLIDTDNRPVRVEVGLSDGTTLTDSIDCTEEN